MNTFQTGEQFQSYLKGEEDIRSIKNLFNSCRHLSGGRQGYEPPTDASYRGSSVVSYNDQVALVSSL